MADNDSRVPDPRLLQPPVARAAYSDRTAWLMAELSALAYEKFEGLGTDLEALAALLAGLADKQQIVERLIKFRALVCDAGSADEAKLRAALDVFGFELVKTFNQKGTQAYLAKGRQSEMAVLAFRGTEKDARDVKADITANFYHDPSSGAKTHTGFLDAFNFVRCEIKDALTALNPARLFITGHSLGGALALVATRHFNSDRIAAVYTYGCPRVGNSEFGDTIKPPLYRIVNAADIVPRLPPSWIVAPLAYAARMIPLAFMSEFVAKKLDGLRGYVHQGDLRYLTGSSAPDYEGLRVISNPDVIRRAMWMFRRVVGHFSTIYRDHSIDEYRGKLRAHAVRRLDA